MSENAKDLAITLKFQVGTAQVTLSELLNLSEGTVIEGDSLYTYFPKVRAVYGEKVLYEGELVKVDDRVAFRITKIL